MSTYTLSGTGIQALSSSVVALHVSIVTLPTEPGHGVANPVDYYGVGFIRPGDASSFWEPMPINGGPQWMPVPNGSTRIGYALQGVSSVTVAEVFGTGPLSFPLASLPDVAVATPTNAEVLTYQSSSSKWINAAAAGGGGGGGDFVKHAEVVLAAAAASVTLPVSGTIPSGYRNLRLVTATRNTAAVTSTNAYVWLRLNGDSAANYAGDSTTAIRIGDTTDSVRAAGVYSSSDGLVFDYTSSKWKTYSGYGTANYDAGGLFGAVYKGMWKSTAAVTSITFAVPTGSYAIGSVFTLYLLK